MLLWCKLLAAAFGLYKGASLYLPLFFDQRLHVPSQGIGAMVALLDLTRLLSGMPIVFVDRQSWWHGPCIASIAATCSASLVTLLSLDSLTHNSDWAVLSLCVVLYGLLYHQLGALVDSAILKVLGDYAIVLLAPQRRWSYFTASLTALCIGLILTLSNANDLHSVLLLVTAAGALVIVPIALLHRPTATDSATLFLFAPLLRKLTAASDSGRSYLNPFYKPYSLFGEPLSHISEEDASVLNRMASNTTNSLMREPSFAGSSRSYLSTNTTTTTAAVLAAQPHQQRIGSTLYPGIELTPPQPAPLLTSSELALLPFCSPKAALLVLWTGVEGNVAYGNALPLAITPPIDHWKIGSLSVTLLLAGILSSLLNSQLFIYLQRLHVPMAVIGLVGAAHVFSQIAITSLARKWTRRWSLMVLATMTHGAILFCGFAYTWLRVDDQATHVAVVILQVLQASALQLLWHVGSHHVNTLLWCDKQRMRLRAAMAVLYSSVGPAVGAVAAGLLQTQTSADPFLFVYRSVVPLSALSFVVSWGWSSDENGDLQM